MKIVLIFIFTLYQCEKLQDIEAGLGFDLDSGTLVDDMEKLQEKIKGCLYYNGLNPQGFNKCCGPNFQNIEKLYLSKYREQQLQLQNQFANRIDIACTIDKDPCLKLIQDYAENMSNDSELLGKIIESKNEVYNEEGINKKLLNLEFNRFQKNFQIFLKNKEFIAQGYLDTINFIQNFIANAPVKNIPEAQSYDPNIFFKMIQLQHWEHDEQKNPNIKIEHKDFHGSLQKEYIPMKLLNYYLSNGIVKKGQYNESQLPSQIIKELKSKNIIKVQLFQSNQYQKESKCKYSQSHKRRTC